MVGNGKLGLFTGVVMYFKQKHVNMLESLKSVE